MLSNEIFHIYLFGGLMMIVMFLIKFVFKGSYYEIDECMVP